MRYEEGRLVPDAQDVALDNQIAHLRAARDVLTEQRRAVAEQVEILGRRSQALQSAIQHLNYEIELLT